uniref:Uncharacterized protein n=1 Tax=Myotis myotis TaxID=51298 RepID=A0A7J7R0L6_MYOMY|nr:hypothetical protein mMyoMyo1_011237 [Myotis myotis]
MPVVLPIVLYLGLHLAQSTQAQNGYLPPPVITAQPGSMVLNNKPVTILCQGPPEAAAYEIHTEEEPEPRAGRKLLVAGKTRTLYIQEMKPDRTGLYRCSYQSGGHWSSLSDSLHLVMMESDFRHLFSPNKTHLSSPRDKAPQPRTKDSRPPSTWTVSPPHRLGPTDATVPSAKTRMCGLMPVTHCSLRSEVRMPVHPYVPS